MYVGSALFCAFINYFMNSTGTATFFLSTGRCGTQWICKALSAVYSDVAVITHEPTQFGYSPRKYLRATDVNALLNERVVALHLQNVKDLLDGNKIYIETGWPCYVAAPLLIDQLGTQCNFVHLVRNPVKVALSLATHNIYKREDLAASAAISPLDEGVVQKDLADKWSTMTEYEKTLFWWTEINLYALELRKEHPANKFFFLRYEDIFSSPDDQLLKALIQFIGLEYRPALEQLKVKNVDKYRFHMTPVDWKLIFKYPKTCALAKELGYDLDDLHGAELSGRYYGGTSHPV